MNFIEYGRVEEKIITIRSQKVLLDSDVAELYGVETKRVNEAVANNPEKFPDGYILAVSEEENKSLRSNISTLEKTGRGQHPKYLPKAFTERVFICSPQYSRVRRQPRQNRIKRSI
jgi:hypothetical protein